MEEKRRFVRLDASVNVEYSIIGKTQEPAESSTKNISMGGICLFLDSLIEKETVLELKIYIAEDPNPIQTRGRIVWVEEFALGEEDKSRHIEAGIEFTRITDEDGLRLSKYIFKSLTRI